MRRFPIAVGLIGLGRHGIRYARHLLNDVPEAELVAVCRRHAELGLGITAVHPVACYADYRDLIRAPEVEALVVATPPSLAHSICLAAVKAHKPILMEKPLALTASEAREMVQAASKEAVPLMTAQTLRFDPTVLALKAAVGTVAPRRSLAITHRIERRSLAGQDPHEWKGRGVLMEVGIHSLDLIRFLTGDEITEVCCRLDPSSSAEPEMRAVITLRTTGGMTCLLDISRETAERMSRLEWMGDGGQLVADWCARTLSQTTGHDGLKQWTLEAQPTLVPALRAFLDAVRDGRPMPITGHDGQRAVEIAEACYRSAAIGSQPVAVAYE
ncbi:MAG: Gfo/Idh/MocA family protein [Nitrospiraceae bacterium]